MTSEAPFSQVFAQALHGEPTVVVGLGADPITLPVEEWTRAADSIDHQMLALCVGATIDIGCGPGRLASALSDLGHATLGIDIVTEAVALTRARGAAALHQDVFDDVPDEGRWHTALLADGNVGIGGDPPRLLRRVRQMIDPRGRIVVELAAPGVPPSSGWVVLEGRSHRSRPFRWAVVGVDDAEALANDAGLGVHAVHHCGHRWVAVLREAT